jgi:muconate cycloisomerase
LSLLDAYGRAFNEPLSTVTRLVAPALYQPQSEVRYSGVITSAKGWKARITAWKFRLFRFRQVKIKVGIEGQDDVARMTLFRRILRDKVDLRVDANEAWKAHEAVEKIKSLEEFGITSVEQPIAHEEITTLTDIRKQIKTPIMLDESLASLRDGELAIQHGWCDLFNLRLSKCGGFIRSLRLAELAKRHGLGYQTGCQVGETSILSAAGRHFACTVGGIRYLEGSYDRHLVRESLGKHDITFGWGGKAPALTGPGLGIQIDLEALKRVSLESVVI